MEVFSQVIAGDGVEHATAEENGADQQIDDVKHSKYSMFPGGRVEAGFRRTVVPAMPQGDIPDRNIESIQHRQASYINSI
jgi:hypothetical protein